MARTGKGFAAFQARARAKRKARGEVLHLALPVHRRVGDDGDGFLEVVSERLLVGRKSANGPS